jgi:AraC family transcriptional regulator
MIYHQFPDLKWLKSQVEQNFADRTGMEGRSLPSKGWPSVVLNVEIKNICRDNIRGPVSIFTNLFGESHVSVHGKKVSVKDHTFFVTNHDQHYTLEIDRTKATTFNIHFGEFFTEQVFAAINQKPDILLEENTFITPFEKITFHNKLHYKSESFIKVMHQLLDAKGNDLLLEEKLFELMTVLLQDHAHLARKSSLIPVIKTATREEIGRRLFQATDYIYSNPDKDIALDELASISCLSKFHFLRLFKLLFDRTPHQFITQSRISRAKGLLKKTSLDINTISRSLGYKDASSFSRAFYNEVGAYPSQYRLG